MNKIKANVKIIIFTVIVIALVAAVGIIVFGRKGKGASAAETGRSNYMEVKVVPGVKFEVSRDLADYATAVMEVSKDIDFVKNASYSYGNGEDTYMLFNMSQYIVIVQKGTNFALDETSVEESLKNNSLNGIWFSKKGGISSGDGKWVIDVTAQVVITNQIYNDFTGKLAVVKNAGTEWSMFVGAVNANDATLADMARYTAGTFGYYAGTENARQTVYEIDTEAKTEGRPELVAMEERTPEPTVEPSARPTEEPDETQDPVQEQKPEQTENPGGDEPEETVQPTEEPSAEKEAEGQGVLVAKDNQKSYSYADDKAYTSSVYNMLSAGQTGYASAINQDTGEVEDIFVRINSYNDEETTKNLIAAHVNGGNAYYETMDAPLGTHWESVSYDVKHEQGKSYYLNVQMVGLDGEKLKYRGIAYAKRSYDITDNVTAEGDWEKGYVSFFAVPNGCSDYAVACGDAVGAFGFKAYYRIKR